MTQNTLIADCGDRPAWRVEGHKALPFLNDMLSQDLAGLAPGHGALAAFLTEKGRIRAIVRVLATADGARIDVDPTAARAIEEGLARIAPLGGTSMVRETRRMFHVRGDIPPDIGKGLGAAEYDHIERDGAVVIRTGWGGAGADILATEARAQGLDDVARVVDPAELEAERIRAGRPVYGIDVDENTLLNETPLLERAVSFTKGCYPGQESVARIRNLGAVRRRLATLALERATLAGERVMRGNEQIGRVTSAAGSVALAMLDASAEPDEPLTVAGSAAHITSS